MLAIQDLHFLLSISSMAFPSNLREARDYSPDVVLEKDLDVRSDFATYLLLVKGWAAFVPVIWNADAADLL